MLALPAVLFALAFALPVPAGIEVGIGFRHEPGVETRLPLSLTGELAPMPRVRLAAGVGLNLLRPGLPDRFALEVGREAGSRAEVAAGVKMRRWPDWRAGENLAFVVARAEPRPWLGLEAGVAYRVPVLDSMRWRSPLAWSSPVSEWNIVYGVGWRFWERPGLRLTARTGNRELLDLRTPSLFGARLVAEIPLGAGMIGSAALAAEMKGLSAALAGLGAAGVELKVGRGF